MDTTASPRHRSNSQPNNMAAAGRSAVLFNANDRNVFLSQSQRGVDVDKDDDYQVENGADDPKHGQNGLLCTFLVLHSSFFITDGSVYHFPRKGLQFPSQTSLENNRNTKSLNTSTIRSNRVFLYLSCFKDV